MPKAELKKMPKPLYVIKMGSEPVYFHPIVGEDAKYELKKGIQGAALFELPIAQDILQKSGAQNLIVEPYKGLIK